MGVDVSAEIDDALKYAQKYPSVVEEFRQRAASLEVKEQGKLVGRLRAAIGDFGGRSLRRRITAYQLAQKMKQGLLRSRFTAFGDDFGFSDILSCAEFIEHVVTGEQRASESQQGDPQNLPAH
jgi:hypothetical protein